VDVDERKPWAVALLTIMVLDRRGLFSGYGASLDRLGCALDGLAGVFLIIIDLRELSGWCRVEGIVATASQ
jgi:hypothetical protein